VLPALSRAAAEERHGDLKRSYSDALGLSLFIAIPAAAAIVILAEPISSVLYLRGRFDVSMLQPTALAMACMAPGIVGVAGVRVTTPAFFARGDTRTPTIIGAVNLVIYVAACLALMGPFDHLGIAMAISIAPIAQCVHLIIELRRRVGPLGLRAVTRSAVRALVGTAAMLLVLYLLVPFGSWEDGSQIGRNVVVLAACVGAGAAIYLFVTRLLGSRELRTILSALRRRSR
jgi:putative peptidoglycan lipid II flippase